MLEQIVSKLGEHTKKLQSILDIYYNDKYSIKEIVTLNDTICNNIETILDVYSTQLDRTGISQDIEFRNKIELLSNSIEKCMEKHPDTIELFNSFEIYKK